MTTYGARLLLAAALSGTVGLERDIRGRAAGLRTNLLVGLGAGAFMMVSMLVGGDPGRIAAQVVSGIGFLGAGVIIREGFSVHGLTTAASLWVSAAIGLVAGAGFAGAAVMVTVLSVGSLMLLNHVERWYQKNTYRVLVVVVPIDSDLKPALLALSGIGVEVLSSEISRDYANGEQQVDMVLRYRARSSDRDLGNTILDVVADSGLAPRTAALRER